MAWHTWAHRQRRRTLAVSSIPSGDPRRPSQEIPWIRSADTGLLAGYELLKVTHCGRFVRRGSWRLGLRRRPEGIDPLKVRLYGQGAPARCACLDVGRDLRVLGTPKPVNSHFRPALLPLAERLFFGRQVELLGASCEERGKAITGMPLPSLRSSVSVLFAYPGAIFILLLAAERLDAAAVKRATQHKVRS